MIFRFRHPLPSGVLPARRDLLRAAALGLMVSLFTAAPMPGASTRFWELSEYKDFLLGEFDNVSLLQPGTLTPAPRLVGLFRSDQPVIWTVAAAPDGTTYVGTGHQGRVYRLDTDGEVSLFWSAPEIEVFALAVGPLGEVYAGTSPRGKLYRITTQGKGEEIFDPGQTYIWSLVVAPSSVPRKTAPRLYMATGGEGKIYTVDASGEGRVFAETKQRHVVSLALDAEGRLLAGADPNGIIYRIDSNGRLFALHDSDQPEIRSLQVAPNGDIYAAAMGGGVSRIMQSVSSFASVSANVSAAGQPGGPAPPQAPAGAAITSPPTTGAAQPVITYSGMERSALLRLRPGQGVEKLWSSNEENILAVGVTGRGNSGSEGEPSAAPQVFFATDRRGRIYRLGNRRLGDRRETSLVTESGREQVTQLAPDAKGLLVASAHTAGLSRLENQSRAAGTYQSAIHDAKTLSRWGRLTWEGEAVGPERLKISTRSGNSAVPDESWSGWSEAAESEGGSGGAGTFSGDVKSPPARYIQWRAFLESKNDSTPLLRRVSLAYLPRNSPPRVSGLQVETALEEGAAASAGSPATSVSSAPKTDAAYSITVSASGSATPAQAAGATITSLGGVPKRGMKISWKAEDPDGDKLTAAVAFRETGGSVWKTIKRDIEAAHVSLDGETLADGTYRFRVVVSDRAGNPPGDAREAEQISEPVLIDHTPPRLRIVKAGGRESVTFEAVDEASALAAAEYAVDAGKWIPIYSMDGILDSRRESFAIPLEGLSEGEHLLTLRVRDRSGNAGLKKTLLRCYRAKTGCAQAASP